MSERGSAMIEFAAVAPVAALFIIVILQFAELFTRAVRGAALAEAKAAAALRDWDAGHASDGFERPCIERMARTAFVHRGAPVRIGAGALRREIEVLEEVKVVSEPICVGP